MWICNHPYCQLNLHHNKNTFVRFHEQYHNSQYWDIDFGKHSFRSALDSYCFYQLINYGKCSFHNALNLSCSCWKLGYGLCFFQNELGLNYDLQSYQNLPSPSYGLHFHQNTFGPLCPFPNLGMTYIFIKTCMALVMAYVLFETHLAFITINIFIRMHLSHNNIFDVFLKHKLKSKLCL